MQGKCYICGRWANLEKHHVYGGARRSISEHYKRVVYLCHECHNEPPNGVHHNKTVRLWLQEDMQRKLMKKYNWSVQDFVSRFYKNYI